MQFTVAQIEAVFTFPKQDRRMPFKLGSGLDAFAKEHGLKFLLPGVPNEAPDNLPRLVVQGGAFIAQICWDRLSVVCTPPDHISESLEEAVSYAKDAVSIFLDSPHLLNTGHLPEFPWCGLVVTLEQTASAGFEGEAPPELFEMFRKLTRLEWTTSELYGFNCSIGKRSDGHFITYGISAFERVKNEVSVLIDPKSNTPQGIERSELKGGMGIELKIDINSKPSIGSTPYGAGVWSPQFDTLAKLFYSTIRNLEQEIGVSL